MSAWQFGKNVEGLSFEEMLTKADLNWEPQLAEVGLIGSNEPFKSVRAMVRSDSRQELGMVTTRYTPISHLQTLEVLDKVAQEKGYTYANAGKIGKGEKVYVSLLTSSKFDGESEIRNRIYFTSGHDGKSSQELVYFPERKVCQNGMHIKIKGASSRIRLQHKGKKEITPSLIADKIRQLEYAQEKFFEMIPLLRAKTITLDNVRDWTIKLFDLKFEDVTDRVKRTNQDLVEKMVDVIYPTAVGQDIEKDNAWKFYSAITYFLSHQDKHNRYNKKDDGNSVVAKSFLWGNTHKIMTDAWTLAMSA